LVYPDRFTIPLIHTEDLDVHHKVDEIYLNYLKRPGQTKANRKFISQMYDLEIEHEEILEKFGRYPYRNKYLGRETTKEEDKWLEDPDRPDWSKA
jgi:uncharacterized protein (DUF924 family)